MDIQQIKNRKLILFECISGSKAYGLDTPESDTDIKGVFVLPKEEFFCMNYIPQISNKSNDIVYYELGRFLELLSYNNPNILELLNTNKTEINIKSSIIESIDSSKILSKLCKNSFGKYAISQIKKSRGLNKKILNPIDKEKKSVLDFCYISLNNRSIGLKEYLKYNNFEQENCGLIKIPNMRNLFGLYHSIEIPYKGIIKNENSNDIALSSIPKGESQLTLLYFNLEGYSTYCKEYREYWAWVEKRNEKRFENTISHGKNYDAKNMMHVFRLLDMAIEIGKEGIVNPKRPNRDYLLSIKNGEHDYEELLKLAESKKVELETVYSKTYLPDLPDIDYINKLHYEFRLKLYEKEDN